MNVRVIWKLHEDKMGLKGNIYMKNKPAKICGHIYENEICVVSDEKARKKISQNSWQGLYFHRLRRKLSILINRSLDLWDKNKSEGRRLVYWTGLNFKKRKGTKTKKKTKEKKRTIQEHKTHFYKWQWRKDNWERGGTIWLSLAFT